MSGPVIPLASRRAESLMPFPIADRSATVPAYPSLLAAGADEAEADTPDGVAADPSIIDAERHPLYGHGVQSHAAYRTVYASDYIESMDGRWTVPNERGAMTLDVNRPWSRTELDREWTRQRRLSLWQEQR